MPRHSRHTRDLSGWVTSWQGLVAATAIGILVVGLSYRLSAADAPPSLYYATFWVGVLVAVLPAGSRLVARSGTRAQRCWALALVGLSTFVPKYLRNPFAPSYHDEYAHWHEATDVLATGRLFQGNSLIPIVEYYPGTAALTASVQRLTGLSVWSIGEVIMLGAHLMALFAVFVLGEVLLRSARAGAVAALVYALNPSEMYFDTQYAYEGVAIAFFMWVLALTSLAARARGRQRAGLLVVALVCAAATVVTHHLTTVFLLVVLALVAVTTTGGSILRARGAGRANGPGVGGALAWWSVLAGLVVMAGAWWWFVARPTVSYLDPYLGGSIDQLVTMRKASGGGGRVLLAASVQPLWERGLAALAPAIAGLICLRALVMARRSWSGYGLDTAALMAFGLIYFPSVLFLFAPSGAEGARRSWAFTYVGLALIGAFVVVRHGSEKQRGWGVPARWHRPVGLTVLSIMLIGGVAAGLNDPYRFPRPFRWGTDTTSASPEARTVAEQLRDQYGSAAVVTDQYTALQMVAYGDLEVASPAEGFPAWNLVQTPHDPDPKLAGDLASSHYDYLVVDMRMADQVPFNQTNFGDGDPLTGQPTPRANLDRLDHVPWASKVMTTSNLRVYRLDLSLVGRPLEAGGPGGGPVTRSAGGATGGSLPRTRR
jgi:hypothetical protein